MCISLQRQLSILSKAGSDLPLYILQYNQFLLLSVSLNYEVPVVGQLAVLENFLCYRSTAYLREFHKFCQSSDVDPRFDHSQQFLYVFRENYWF